jgi:tetratricopeptide (TPR) repeat protein
MLNLASALQDMAGALQVIADTATGDRRRRAAVAALAMRVVQSSLNGEPGHALLARRATAELARLPSGAERSILSRVVHLADEGTGEACGGALSTLLVAYAFELESTQRLPEAELAIALACSVAPDCAETALHAGRVARKLRRHEEALVLYRRAQALDADDGPIARLGAIGEAVVSPGPERGLGLAMRRAVRAGDAEAAAVALEERARSRRARGQPKSAVRDLCMAVLRFTDPVDRARAAHELTDVAMTLGDAATAREALLIAVVCGNGPQQDHARSRLYALARSQGDQVGLRRWRTFGRPSLVSITSSRVTDACSPAAAVLGRLRERLEGLDHKDARDR